MRFLKISAFILVNVLLIGARASGQNFVVDFHAEQLGEKIRVSITAQQEVRYELIPFDSRAYTLLKIFPLQFQQETRKQFLAPLKSLPLKIQVVELTDKSLLLAFKGVVSERIHVQLNRSKNKILVEVSGEQVSGLVPPGKKGKTAEEYYQEAVQFEKQGLDSRALGAIHRALRQKPNFAEAYYLAGKIRLHRGEWRKAKINFTKARRFNPSLPGIEKYLQKSASKNENSPTIRPEKTTSPPSNQMVLDTTGTSISVAVPSETLIKKPIPAPTGNFDGGPEPVLRSRKKRTSTIPMPRFPRRFRREAQLALFSLIILFSLLWLVVLWRKRTTFIKPKPRSHADFARLLQTLQQNAGVIGKDMPEFHAQPIRLLEKKGERVSERERERKTYIENSRNQKKISRSFEMTRQTEGSEMGEKRSFENGQDLEEKVMFLASMGYSMEEIAQRLGIGKVEVQLLLNFQGRQVPMSAPEVRIDMDLG